MNDLIIETGAEGIKDVNSAEELDALLDGAEVELDDQGNIKDKTGQGQPPAKKEDETDDDEIPKLGKVNPKPSPQPAKAEGKEGDGKDKGGDNETYDNVIHYLDKRHSLGLNLQELPTDMTREDEAELVSNLFERVVANANAQLRQYEQINELLQDDEVAALLQAKSEGKGLKDLFAAYSTTPEGMSDDQIVFNDLKKKYPKLSEATLNNMIATQKEKGQFTEIAAAIREQTKEDETKSAAQRAANEEAERARQQQEYEQEVNQFTGLVQKVQKINGVVFTDDMKSEVLNFAIKRDNQGLSELDKALQSDVGVLRASLGIILLEKLMSAQSSVLKNQGKKSVFEKLLTKPEQAAAAAGSTRRSEEVPDEVFNRW